jgi:hypothetical protein
LGRAEALNSDPTIAVLKLAMSKHGTPSSVSAGSFSIYSSKVLKWVFPNGGEYIWEDTLITWTSSGVNSVNIDYTEDNGQSWTPVISNFPSTGAYYWHLPIVPPATLARLRVTDASDPTVTDMSDNPFNLWIKSAIKLVRPVGNNTYPASAGLDISWNAIDLVTSVKIEYSSDNGKSWNIIARNVPSC